MMTSVRVKNDMKNVFFALFLAEFRKNDAYDNIPIIVATSNNDDDSELRCLEYGVWDFVMKPYNPLLLQFRIKNAMDKSRMTKPSATERPKICMAV